MRVRPFRFLYGLEVPLKCFKVTSPKYIPKLLIALSNGLYTSSTALRNRSSAFFCSWLSTLKGTSFVILGAAAAEIRISWFPIKEAWKGVTREGMITLTPGYWRKRVIIFPNLDVDVFFFSIVLINWTPYSEMKIIFTRSDNGLYIFNLNTLSQYQ